MRRWTWPVVGVLLLSTIALVWSGWRDATAALGHLEDAQRSLQEGETALREQDPSAAASAFRAAATSGRLAGEELQGPAFRVAGLLPRVGDGPALARGAADLAAAAGELGAAAADTASEYLDGSALGSVLQGGRVDLDAIAALAGTLEGLPVDPVRDARDAIAATRPERLPDLLLPQREQALDAAAEAITAFETASEGLDALGELLGRDAPRAYLLAAQNPSELRGTGGLIGFMTVVRFFDGDIAIGEGTSFDAEEELAQRTQFESQRDLDPPVERSDEFAARYDAVAGGQFIGSVNLDPDLPTVGPVLQRLYERTFGTAVDGVILMDPIALGAIVEATESPLTLPGALETAGLPHEFPGSRIPSLVMVEGYDAFEGGGSGKKAYDRAVIGAALDRLLSHEWEGPSLIRTMRELVATRRIQVWSDTPTTQAALEAAGAAGAMTRPDGADVLAVTGSNAAPNKADVHVAHRMTGQVALTATVEGDQTRVRRTTQLEISVDNPLRPEDHDAYITGSSPPVLFGSGPPPRRQDALVRTWFNVWAPALTVPTSPVDGVAGLPLRIGEIHGHRVVDAYLETPSASTTSLAVELDGPAPVRVADDGDVIYELTLWRQAKAIPDHWDLTFTPPDGWAIEDAGLEGGGSPRGTGVGGQDGAPIALVVADGSVRVTGAVTRDVMLTVRMSRP